MSGPAAPRAFKPDWEAFRDCILRRGTPSRAHFAEFGIDWEIQNEIGKRLDLFEGLDRSDPYFAYKYEIAIQRALGYDYVHCGLGGIGFEVNRKGVKDTAALGREGGRYYVDEQKGPVTNWEEFEKYPWPKREGFTTRGLEWYERNLPDDMCVVAVQLGHFFENISFLLGYETMCDALQDNYGLLQAIARKLEELYAEVARVLVQFKRVQFVWGSDDMGYRGGLLLAPRYLRELVLPGHRMIAEIVHDAGKIYLHHNCGKLDLIMKDLIDDVKIDGKHSFEDNIERVEEAKSRYGDKVALLGGIDVDFLCRAGKEKIRGRVRETLRSCQPGGGFALGSGNTVANYVPVDNFLAMLDEGRKFSA